MTSGRAIGFPLESGADERRTLLTRDTATVLRDAGFQVLAEPGIGRGIYLADEELAACGVRFATTDQVWSAPLVLRYKSPDAVDLYRLARGQSIGALFHAEGDPRLLNALVDTGVTAYSYEFLNEHGHHPLGVPGGEIAGVQAVLAGALALQRHHGGRGVLLAAVAGVPAPRVVVIGTGNVGSAAARTAAGLGAHVTVLARSAQSAAHYAAHALAGADVQVNSPDTLATALPDADLVIGAILISTFDTPAMITDGDLRTMKAGAVIVDATCGYGAGYLPTCGPVQEPGDPPHEHAGILHIKIDVLPALTPVTTSQAYAATAAPYLCRLARTVLHAIPDPAIDSARIAHAGRLVHPVCRAHAAHYARVPA